MPAAKATRPGYISAAVYVAEDVWRKLRKHAVDRDVSASAIIAALIEQYLAASAADQAATLQRAREITLGRRRRAE